MTTSFEKAVVIRSRRAEGCLCCGDADEWVIGLADEELNNLEFHHVDPTTKRFNILSVGNRSFADFVTEIDKTVVLCSSCHRLVHAGRHTIERSEDETSWICRRNRRELAERESR